MYLGRSIDLTKAGGIIVRKAGVVDAWWCWYLVNYCDLMQRTESPVRLSFCGINIISPGIENE